MRLEGPIIESFLLILTSADLKIESKADTLQTNNNKELETKKNNRISEIYYLKD